MSEPSGRRRRIEGESNGEPGRNRTFNQQIKSLLLCQLSYGPVRVVQVLPSKTAASSATRGKLPRVVRRAEDFAKKILRDWSRSCSPPPRRANRPDACPEFGRRRVGPSGPGAKRATILTRGVRTSRREPISLSTRAGGHACSEDRFTSTRSCDGSARAAPARST